MSTTDKLYLDEIEKITYYKQRIVDQYIEKGTMIDKNKLQEKLNDIDMKLSIFRQEFIANGETMDVEKFNRQKHDLYLDLCILYRVAYKIAQEKLATAEHRINCQIQELNQIAKRYQYRTALETLSIYGDSVYYETNGFDQRYEDGNIIIDLGPLSIPSGSYVACICDSDEIASSDITFNFDDQYRVSDYNYGKRYLKVLGEYNINTSVIERAEESLTAFNVAIDNISEKSRYNIYAGKDKISILSETNPFSARYIDKTNNIPITVEEDCDISFYIYGATTISFNHNNKYEYKSFNDYKIDSPKFRQKILISAKAGFTFDVITDGTIYADKQLCTVDNSDLICPVGYKGVYDFLLEEIAFGADVEFNNVQIVAKNATVAFYDINYVAVKIAQISELDGDIE